MARPPRRALLGGATGEGLDAELIGLCQAYVTAEAEHTRLVRLADINPGETDTAKSAAAEAKVALDCLLCDRLLGRIAQLPARTPEGLRAKALAVHSFYLDTEPPGEGDMGGAALWSLVLDVAGRVA